MKRSLLTVGLLLLGFSSISQITSFPYLEDFEGGPAGWTPSGALWQQGVPTTTLMSEADEQCINNVFATNLTGNYGVGNIESVTSPSFDLSGLTVDPIIQFDMFRNNESCCDEVWVEQSLDAGVTWTKVTAGINNWYNDLGNQWWDNNTSNGYEKCTATLVGAAGVTNAQVRFVFTSDGSVTFEGMAFDNVTISEPTFADLELVEVLSPVSGPNLGSTESITIVVANNGPATVPFTDFAFCYTGDVPQGCETTVTDILGYSLDTITLPLSTLDLSSVGNTYNISFYISIIGSNISTCNDTLNLSVTNFAPVSNYPYTEDFENGAGEWTTSAGVWEHGVPTTSGFTSVNTSCNNNAIVTDLDANYPNGAFDFIESPYFNFGALGTDPIIKFDMYRLQESCCDETWLEYTLDEGQTWNKVLSGIDNWFNDAGNQWWDNNTAGWQNTEAELTGLAGEASVRFRFVFSSDGSVNFEGIGVDNIYIGDTLYNDLQLVEILSPTTTTICSTLPYSDSIQVVVTNNGNSDAAPGNFAVCYGGGLPVTCDTIQSAILAGTTDTLTLSTSLIFQNAGTFDVDFFLNAFNGPLKTCDDTLSQTFTIGEQPVSNIPDTTACDLSQIDVTAVSGSGFTYLWSTGATSSFTTITASGTYNLWVTSPGCPTVIDTFNVDLSTSTSATDVISACDSFTWIDGNTYTANNNAATFTLTNVSGCDSVVTLDLTINTVDVATTTVDFTITADASAATYQWIDCDNNNTPINGETGQSFTATVNGNYAVIVTENGCSDTSACVAITTIGLPENGLTNFALYPNPTAGTFAIDFNEVQESVTVRVMTLSGQVVATSEASNTNRVEMTIDAATGVYLVELTDQYNQKTMVRVVKK